MISVASLKGGVGKTSTVLGLAGAAASRGLRTLVVDLDPQANATTVLDPPEVHFTANDVLADGRAGVLEDAITATSWGRQVDVVAAEPALEHRNAGADGRLPDTRLRVTMQGLSGYDLVLLDCPPSLGQLTKHALAASSRVLIVTEPTLFALQGAQQALDAVEVVRRSVNLALHPAGITVNKVRAGSAEHRYRVAELTSCYGSLVLDPVMPDRSAVLQAQGAFRPVQDWPTPGAREAAAVYAAHLDHVLASAHEDGPLYRARHRDPSRAPVRSGETKQ